VSVGLYEVFTLYLYYRNKGNQANGEFEVGNFIGELMDKIMSMDAQELSGKEDFKVWFYKEFKNIKTEYAGLVGTNFVDCLKCYYDDDRQTLVDHQKDIFDDYLDTKNEAEKIQH
jgi:hypothetical protein